MYIIWYKASTFKVSILFNLNYKGNDQLNKECYIWEKLSTGSKMVDKFEYLFKILKIYTLGNSSGNIDYFDRSSVK